MEHSIRYEHRAEEYNANIPLQIRLWSSPLTPVAFCVGSVCLYSCHRGGELTYYGALFVTVMLPDNNRFKSITMAAPLEQ